MSTGYFEKSTIREFEWAKNLGLPRQGIDLGGLCTIRQKHMTQHVKTSRKYTNICYELYGKTTSEEARYRCLKSLNVDLLQKAKEEAAKLEEQPRKKQKDQQELMFSK